MRVLIVLGLVLLVTANSVNSGAIYRRYRELELPGEAPEALPAESFVAELRKDQIPVQLVDVIEPVLVVKPVENLRSVEPEIVIADAEPASVITNEIISEKVEKLEEKLEGIRAIEQELEQAERLPRPQLPVAEAALDVIVQKEEQKLRNIEPELPTAPVLVEQASISQNQEEPVLSQETEKKRGELPEALPEIIAKEPLAVAIIEEKKSEKAEPLQAMYIPKVKSIKEDLPLVDKVPAVLVGKEVELPLVLETKPELKSLEENLSSAAELELKPLKEEKQLLIESPKKEEILEELKEELLQKKKEDRREEKKGELKEEKKDELKEEKTEILKEAVAETIKEEIKEELKEKIEASIAEDPQRTDKISQSLKQADNADPGATTARPNQGFIQQLVQNTPLGQLFNNFNGNNQAAIDENTPAATAGTFIQAIQNTTSQITNSIQQGFQQQLQSLQTTFSGQPAQAAAATGDAAPVAPTARPQGPLQSIVTSFLGNGAQQQPAAAAQPQPTGPLQGILNLFGGNRAPTAAPAAAAISAASTPGATESLPGNDQANLAPAEVAAEEASPDVTRDSVEAAAAEESQEEVKPDEIVVDDDTHE